MKKLKHRNAKGPRRMGWSIAYVSMSYGCHDNTFVLEVRECAFLGLEDAVANNGAMKCGIQG
jgi:hypothetical protein